MPAASSRRAPMPRWLRPTASMRGWRGCNSRGRELSDPAPEEWADLRCQWFGSVNEIANLEMQRSTWLAPPTPSPHWSYVEFCSKFPGTDQLEYALDRGHLSRAEFDLLAALCGAIGKHQP